MSPYIDALSVFLFNKYEQKHSFTKTDLYGELKQFFCLDGIFYSNQNQTYNILKL
jgi:hypothetical protein